MKKKVLLISLRTDLGGGPKHLLDLITELQKQTQFDLYFAGPNDPPFGELIRRHSVASFDLIHRRFSISALFKLKVFCRFHEIDLIHSHGRGAGIYSRVLAIITGLPCVHTFHGLHFHRKFSGYLKVAIDRLLQPFTSHTIFVSNDELQQARELGIIGQRYSVIENGINLNQIDLTIAKSIVEKDPNVLSAGSLLRADYFKAPELLIQKFDSYLKTDQHADVKLMIAGLKESDLRLSSDLNPKIRIMGSLFPPFSFLKSLDLYISSARHEGLPIAVLEAMAMGVPCLLSKVKGHLEFIQKGAAIGFDLEDDADFHEKLHLLLIDSEKRNQIAEKARQLVRTKHTTEIMTSRVVQIYENILGGLK